MFCRLLLYGACTVEPVVHVQYRTGTEPVPVLMQKTGSNKEYL